MLFSIFSEPTNDEAIVEKPKAVPSNVLMLLLKV